MTMTEERVAPTPSTGSTAPLTFGICLLVLATAFEGIGVASAMPRIAADLHGISVYGWAFSLFTIGMLFGTIVAGRFADQRGPIRPGAVGIAIFGLGLVVAGSAPTMLQLLAGRLVQGIGAGSMNVVLYVIIARAYSEQARPGVMTMLSAAWVLPSLIGPAGAAWVTETFSWHWVFLGLLPILVIGAVAMVGPLRAVRHTLGPSDNPATPVPTWVGLVIGLTVGLVQFGGQLLADGELSPVVAAGIALAGLVALGLVLPRLMPAGTMRLRRGLPSVMWCRMLVAGAFFGADAFIPLMLVQTRGMTLFAAASLITVGSLAWFAGAWLQSQPWFRISRPGMIVLGSFLVAVGVFGMALVAWLPALPVWLGAILWMPAGLGMGFTISNTGLALMNLSPRAEQGRNSSALQTGEAIGTGLLTGLSGSIFAMLHLGHPVATPFVAIMLTMAAFGVGAGLTARRIGHF